MKLTDKLLQKVGADKLLHLSMTGWLVSLVQSSGLIAMFLMTNIIIILSIIKELWLDKKADWVDMYFALAGMAMSWMIYLICNLIWDL